MNYLIKNYSFKTITTFLICVFSLNTLYSEPILNKNRYLISSLLDNNTGAVSIGTTNYPIIYNPTIDTETATDDFYWIITKLGDNEYCFQNSLSKKYIKYNDNAATPDRVALVLVDALQADKSTSFSLELKVNNNLCYYVIHSVINSAKVWDRRTTQYEGVYPLGVYSSGGSGNQSFIFYGSDGDAVMDTEQSVNILPTTIRTVGSFSSYADSLSVNHKAVVPNTASKQFFVSLTENQMGSNISLPVNFGLKNTAHNLYINNKLVHNGDIFSFGTITSTSSIPIEIRNGTTVISSGTIVFSCLPLVQIFTPNRTLSDITGVYNLMKIAVTEASKPDTTEVMYSKLRIRGGISTGYPKNSYAIKLINIDGATSMDRTFFGLRSDNNWILDAMYIDPARMRNRVSTDVWEAFSSRPYYAASEPSMVNGTRGHFVEVFSNDAYLGLYCMTEKVDRKQLKLKKFQVPDPANPSNVVQRGGLYKGSGWDVGTFIGNNMWDGTTSGHNLGSYNNNSETWSAYEVKYPDMGDGEQINWKPLYDAIYATSYLVSNDYFKTNVSTYFDLPVFLDYYLYIELMLATDNQGKNTYMSVYDQTKSPKICITPWDMDGTWGRRWDGGSYLTGPNQTFDKFLTDNEHAQALLFLNLKGLDGSLNQQYSDYDNYKLKLRERYKQLRGSYFTVDTLMGRFNAYNKLFIKSGADLREKNKWSVYPSNEMSFLNTWITSRLAFLDNQYLGGPYVPISTDNGSLARSNLNYGPNPVENTLNISGVNIGERVQIVSVTGSLLYDYVAHDSTIRIDMSSCQKGIYLLRVGMQTAKVIKR